MEQLITFLPLVLMFGIMYVILILPQRRREKKTREMLDALKVGENITTIGGIMGKVINIKDDEITIESGIEKTKIKVKRWAIKEVEKLVEA
ncbi:MAG: preprotein translocase subunit YajC [Clostridia bacterium]|nr:preprotein translocase subunit YajC [Clostridia bacterium]